MKKFNKIVAIEPINMLPFGKEKLRTHCEQLVLFDDIPSSTEEIINRIGDADCLLVSYTTFITAEILSACPNLEYIGMCCSLYSEESASVDIRYAREHNITVTGIRDYGDNGVAEYVIGELVEILHGFHGKNPFFDEPAELTNLKVGVLGMGTTGQIVANALQFFGSHVSYYSRTRKDTIEKKGIRYNDLHALLKECDVICCCLSKNITLLHEEELKILGNHKIIFNTALSPSFDVDAMEKWLSHPENHYYCDTLMAIGNDHFLSQPNVHCAKQSAGMTKQAVERLNQKVLDNMEQYLKQ
ncbi:NAD(P)-dependent oxidoreductase [Faecalimonas sp.]